MKTCNEMNKMAADLAAREAPHPDSVKLAKLVKEAQIVVAWSPEPPDDWPVAKRIEFREDFAALEAAIKDAKSGAVEDVAALLEDKERLDWLDANPRRVLSSAGYRGEADGWSYFDSSRMLHDAATIRAAIDAARNGGAEK